MSGVSAGQLRQLSATLIATAPTVNDDASKNYMVGSCVFCAFDSTFYECTDNTIGAAVWAAVSGGGSVNSVTGESVDNTDPVNPVVNAWPLAGTGTDLANGTIEVDPAFSGDLILQDDGITSKTIQFDVGLKQVRIKVEDIASGEQSFLVLNPNRALLAGGGTDAVRSEKNTFTDAGTYPFTYEVNNIRWQTIGQAAPTINDDSLIGYLADSIWIYNGTLYICTDATPGAAVWVAQGGGTPAGSNGDIQFNTGGSFDAEPELHWDTTSKKLSVNGDDSMTVNGAAISTHLQVHASDGITETEVELHRHGATAAAGAQLYGARSRGTEAAPTVVSNGDRLLSVTAVGYDGTDYATSSQIDFEVDAAPGNNDMPGRIVFKTSADGGQTLTERAKIDSAGNFNIDGLTASRAVVTDASKNLGSSATTAAQLGYLQGISSPANGDIFYFDGTNIVKLTSGTAGQVLQTNGVAAPTWVEQWKEVVLSSNVTTTLDTAVDVTGLSFSLAANSKYKARFTTRIGCSGTGGVKFGYSCPVDTVASTSYIGSGANTGAQTAAGGSSTGSALSSLVFNAVAQSIGMYWVEYLIVTGATAGTFQVQFASTTAGQTSTVFSTNACLEYKKIA